MAIDSLLSHIIYFTEFNLNFSNDLILYSVPIITFICYLLTTIIIIKRIKIKSELNGIFLTDFPIKWFIILTVITLFIIPITNWLNGFHSRQVAEIGKIGNVSYFFYIQTWLESGIMLSGWIMIIGLAFVFINKYNKLKSKN